MFTAKTSKREGYQSAILHSFRVESCSSYNSAGPSARSAYRFERLSNQTSGCTVGSDFHDVKLRHYQFHERGSQGALKKFSQAPEPLPAAVTERRVGDSVCGAHVPDGKTG